MLYAAFDGLGDDLWRCVRVGVARMPGSVVRGELAIRDGFTIGAEVTAGGLTAIWATAAT